MLPDISDATYLYALLSHGLNKKSIMSGKLLAGLFSGTLSLALFTGCMKDTPIEPPKPVSYVSVMNTSLTSPAVEMLLNNEKVTPPMNPGTVFSRYSAIEPGALNVTFKKAGADSLVASLPAGEYYDSSKFYTVLLYDKIAGGAGAVRIQDVFPTSDVTKAYIRFFQLSMDMPEVDLYFDNTKVFSARTPADNTTSQAHNSFQAYVPGSYSIKAKVAGKDSVIASTTFSDLIATGYYTIFLKGVNGGTGARGYSVEVLRAAN